MAEIRIDPEQWNAISAAEQKKIEAAFKKIGAIEQADSLVAGDVGENIERGDLTLDLCNALCDIAATSAIAWCVNNTGEPARSICIAAAESARRECKRHC